ncbi:hypothetical protein HDU96_001610 [Phlyctochytrium bullatum]|nr:hypothetical protein HDU96_001610 [Phlyctochytrium bullatum]
METSSTASPHSSSSSLSRPAHFPGTLSLLRKSRSEASLTTPTRRSSTGASPSFLQALFGKRRESAEASPSEAGPSTPRSSFPLRLRRSLQPDDTSPRSSPFRRSLHVQSSPSLSDFGGERRGNAVVFRWWAPPSTSYSTSPPSDWALEDSLPSPEPDPDAGELILYEYEEGDEGEGEGEECVVCAEAFKEGDVMGLVSTCLHRFHGDCLRMWVDRSRTCPVCRASVGWSGVFDRCEVFDG